MLTTLCLPFVHLMFLPLYKWIGVAAPHIHSQHTELWCTHVQSHLQSGEQLGHFYARTLVAEVDVESAASSQFHGHFTIEGLDESRPASWTYPSLGPTIHWWSQELLCIPSMWWGVVAFFHSLMATTSRISATILPLDSVSEWICTGIVMQVITHNSCNHVLCWSIAHVHMLVKAYTPV